MCTVIFPELVDYYSLVMIDSTLYGYDFELCLCDLLLFISSNCSSVFHMLKSLFLYDKRGS